VTSDDLANIQRHEASRGLSATAELLVLLGIGNPSSRIQIILVQKLAGRIVTQPEDRSSVCRVRPVSFVHRSGRKLVIHVLWRRIFWELACCVFGILPT